MSNCLLGDDQNTLGGEKSNLFSISLGKKRMGKRREKLAYICWRKKKGDPDPKPVGGEKEKDFLTAKERKKKRQ